MGGETGKNFRVPVTAESATRCFRVTTTPALTQAFEGNNNHTATIGTVENVLHNNKDYSLTCLKQAAKGNCKIACLRQVLAE